METGHMQPLTERSRRHMAHPDGRAVRLRFNERSAVHPRISENRLQLSEQAADHRPLARLRIRRLGVSDLTRTDIEVSSKGALARSLSLATF